VLKQKEKTLANKQFFALVFVGMILFGSIISGCATTPLENTVKLEFGGTLPPEVLSYFDESQLRDMDAKFILVQGKAQIASGGMCELVFGPPTIDVAILITVGKEYRIAQMSRYIKPYQDTLGNHPGQHQRLERIDVVPNMATKYNSLQEAQLASEMGA
jgi:hypothetical protein